MKTINYTVLSAEAIVTDAQGCIQNVGVEVCDFGDSVSIGATEHLKEDLTITTVDGVTTIGSIHGWEVRL